MIQELIHLLLWKGYKLYYKEPRLNIVGVRSSTAKPNRFDDSLVVFWNDNGEWKGKTYPITTDPGLYWLNNPMNVNGTAILAESQFVDSYKLGLHQGKYEALVQRLPVTVIRDSNRDSLLDFNSQNFQTGFFGINIHHAGEASKQVDKWSAGCQVFANKKDFREFITLCKKHRDNFENVFTYTLVNERDLMEVKRLLYKKLNPKPLNG